MKTKNQHIFSIVLWVIGVLMLLLFGLVGSDWTIGLLLAAVFLLAGIFYYRRGK